MKKILYLFSLATLVACGGDEPPSPPTSEGILVNENITGQTTWYSDSIYVLGGRISVTDGAVLTIEPGCIIKGGGGTGAAATALLVARGGKIYAQGTASAPIIFTSVADEIQPGMLASPNLTPDMVGLWGGVIILGKAPVSATTTPIQIEGIPTSDPNGLYGGTDTLDNSGMLAYVSIRHGGANIGAGNEINGLTLGGVGKGTLINNIEVVANQDDGIEIFGGCVETMNLVIYAAQDDQLDIDQGYFGSVQNFVTINGALGDHGLEIDGGESTAWNGYLYLWNGTVQGLTTVQCNWRDKAEGFVSITGDYNIVANSGTNITLDTAPVGADKSVFYWTLTNYLGKL